MKLEINVKLHSRAESFRLSRTIGADDFSIEPENGELMLNYNLMEKVHEMVLEALDVDWSVVDE